MFLVREPQSKITNKKLTLLPKTKLKSRNNFH